MTFVSLNIACRRTAAALSPQGALVDIMYIIESPGPRCGTVWNAVVMSLSAPAGAGAPVVEVSCTLNLDQEWFISQVVVRDHRTGSCMCTRTYNIFHSIPSQMCLTMSDPSGANGSPVVQRPCQISNSLQYWLAVVSDANVNPPANHSTRNQAWVGY